jgi:DNA-binding GntR family transcriptional regulator
MQQLLELRLGLEHAAAGLSAERLPAEKAQEILDRAMRMRAAFEKGDARAFFEADADFHRIMLSGTQNDVISQLADTIGMTLDIRRHDTRPGMLDLSADAVEMHVDLARALVDRDASLAQRLALELVQLTLADFTRTQARTLT